LRFKVDLRFVAEPELIKVRRERDELRALLREFRDYASVFITHADAQSDQDDIWDRVADAIDPPKP
jgi:hypothetical protein